LGSQIGFDGAVWGSGIVDLERSSPFKITRADVVDRPASLLDEYPDVAPQDPATASFLAFPHQSMAVSASDYSQANDAAEVGEYLRRHRIAHFALLGRPGTRVETQQRTVHWITAYRQSGKPFGERDLVRLRALLPLWDQAHEICLVRHMERFARAQNVSSSLIAICDENGVIHAAEPAFSELTHLYRGDRIERDSHGRLPTLRRGDLQTQQIRVMDHSVKNWTLMQATCEHTDAPLSLRETQVARRFADGLSYKEIARETGASPSTVRTQLQNIYRRLDVHSRTGLQRAVAALSQNQD